jgi:hypothetical protein
MGKLLTCRGVGFLNLRLLGRASDEAGVVFSGSNWEGAYGERLNFGRIGSNGPSLNSKSSIAARAAADHDDPE